MRPAARLAAAAELLDHILAQAQADALPADACAAAYFRKRRYAGSKDRRAVLDMVYQALRHMSQAKNAANSLGVTLDPIHHILLHQEALTPDLFDGPHALPYPHKATLADLGLVRDALANADAAPLWLMDHLRAQYGIEAEQVANTLLNRAPVDLRANRLKGGPETVLKALKAQGIAVQQEAYPLVPSCHLRLAGERPTRIDAVEQGLAEVQDAGAQWVCGHIPIDLGQTVVDFCAGAGGKSLAVAAQMNNRGSILATDISARKLQEAEKRAARAGVSILQTHTLPKDGPERVKFLEEWAGQADHVVVDAPCSGSGTWRRNPDLVLRLTEAKLEALTQLQARLLHEAASLVKLGGTLSYITCSVLAAENQRQVAQFLTTHDDFQTTAIPDPLSGTAQDWIQLLPHRHDTDGFFLAHFKKI